MTSRTVYRLNAPHMRYLPHMRCVVEWTLGINPMVIIGPWADSLNIIALQTALFFLDFSIPQASP